MNDRVIFREAGEASRDKKFILASRMCENAINRIKLLGYFTVNADTDISYTIENISLCYINDKVEYMSILQEKQKIINRKKLKSYIDRFVSDLENSDDASLLEFGNIKCKPIYFFNMIDDLKSISKLSEDMIKSGAQRGARELRHVKNLVGRLISLYEFELGQKFAKNFDRYKCEGKPDEFIARGPQFVHEVARAIDGDVSIEQVETAMKGWQRRQGPEIRS